MVLFSIIHSILYLPALLQEKFGRWIDILWAYPMDNTLERDLSSGFLPLYIAKQNTVTCTGVLAACLASVFCQDFSFHIDETLEALD